MELPEETAEEHDEVPEASPQDLPALFRWMWPYVRPSWRIGLVLLAGVLLEAGFESFMRLSAKLLIDKAIVPQDWHLLVLILAALAAGAVLTQGCALACDYLWARFGTLVMNRLREHIFVHLQRLSMDFHSRAKVGDLMTRFTGDLESVEVGLTYALPAGVLQSGSLLISAALLFKIEWRLALLTVIGLPFCFLAQKLFGRRAVEADVAYKQAGADLASVVQENLSAQPVVKAFNLQERMVAQFRERLAVILATGVRSNFISYLLERLPNLGVECLSIVVIGAGAVLCFKGRLSVGSLVAFQVMLAGMSSSVSAFTWVIPYLIGSAGGMVRIRMILDQRPQVQDGAQAAEAPGFEQPIELRGVRFRYGEGQGGIEDVQATLPARARIAFVGASGSGKSTLLALLMRFYDPEDGEIRLGGQDLRAVSLESLRRRIGLVSQENFLFNVSIRENIRLGNLAASDAQIEAAARQAEIHDHIASLPDGYDSLAGERGARLSGGQRQRVAIARALVRQPQLLLLDEATSALDPGTEAAVNATLERAAQGRTTVIVTHRLASVVGADRILVFDQGRLVEQGRHEELLRQDGAYAHLWRKQNGFAVDPSGERFQIDLGWLRELAFFQSLAPEVLEGVARAFVTERVPADRVVMHQGDPGEKFYIIVRGRVVVAFHNASGRKPFHLTDGDYFGEIALLKSVPRTATIRTLTPCVLLSLRQEQFLDLMQRAPALRAALEASHLSRPDGTCAL